MPISTDPQPYPTYGEGTPAPDDGTPAATMTPAPAL
jgi:hypothetical protein